MFQFGLFSTFIPYLIFGISYIGFLSLNALENDKGFDFTNTTTQYELKIQNLENATDYQIDLSESVSYDINEYSIKHFRNLLFTRKLFDIEIKKRYFYYYFNSRPPPVFL